MQKHAVDMSVAGKTALITGSTSGIGRSTAKLLAAKGCSVLVTGSRSPDDAHEALKDIQSTAVGKVHFVQSDLRDDTQVLEVCRQADQIFPEGINILVINTASSDDCCKQIHGQRQIKKKETPKCQEIDCGRYILPFRSDFLLLRGSPH
nr:uncharacterized oxidoreductase YhxC-like isoform X2 [Crassostrea gigas]